MFYIYGDPEDGRLAHIESFITRNGGVYELYSTEDPENVKVLYELGFESVPQVFLNDEEEDAVVHVGGYDDLVSYIEMVTSIER